MIGQHDSTRGTVEVNFSSESQDNKINSFVECNEGSGIYINVKSKELGTNSMSTNNFISSQDISTNISVAQNANTVCIDIPVNSANTLLNQSNISLSTEKLKIWYRIYVALKSQVLI